jgi:aminoglycoside phosphotransferase (APT) family kinase protein
VTSPVSGDWQLPAASALVARGREAEVWDVGDRAVLKLYLDASNRRGATQEASVLSALRAMGLPVPAVIEEIVLDGRPGLVIERVPGPDMLTTLGRRPWLILRAGPALARAQVAVNDVPAPIQLPSIKLQLRDRITHSSHLNEAERGQVLRILEAQADGAQLCHGDLHLENLLGTVARPSIIDWSNAAGGPPAADVARSLVILQFGEAPPVAPVVVQRLAPALRGLVVSSYIRSYKSMRPGYLQGLDEWMIVQAAARLGETTQSESSLIRTWLARVRNGLVR